MAVSSSRGITRNAELFLFNNNNTNVSRKFKDTDDATSTITSAPSPDRNRVWIEPKSKNGNVLKKVPVVYYLSRNGHLDHPHFIEVPLSSPHGLYLKDVINRLDVVRGKGMASLYSWSSKRSYRNSFVWHDLTENDFIYPSHGHEYVLKGSELLDPSLCANKSETTAFSKPPEGPKATSCEEPDSPVVTQRRNQSWSSIDLNEYKVYKTESFSESTRKLAADAATQTDDKRRRRRLVKKEEEIEELSEEKREEIEISPPPSDSSPETLESLMKADGRLILGSGNSNTSNNNNSDESINQTVENCGKIKASTVLMQLISCGSISFRACGATAVKEQGLSLIGQYKGRLPRGGRSKEGISKEFGHFEGVRLEDKEYFSGSLLETKKEEIPALKRSNSYNVDRHLHLSEKEVEEGARTKCIPRKPKAFPAKKETNITESNCNSHQGSKRFDSQQVENGAK